MANENFEELSWVAFSLFKVDVASYYSFSVVIGYFVAYIAIVFYLGIILC